MSYQPRDGSLAERLCAHFRANPFDELDNVDIAKRFDVNQSSIAALLNNAINAGHIQRLSKGCYAAGPKLGAEKAAPAAAPAPASADAPPKPGFQTWLATKGQEESKGGGAGAALLPDPASLVIEAGIPIPEAQSEKVLRYAAKFAEMKVGDSFGCSHGAAKALITSASRWGKSLNRRFVMRRTTATEARIWRKE
ncbi:hypothetical protein ACG04Q_11945 [Roseateles sp. DXS20W]|uniref:MarR family transcriptional regulator n=1 Tax=Pelomonas lactea TaxID=3299030 RepID=A0ABW7GJZ1_9BURK